MAAAELGGSAQHMERSWRRPFLSVPKLCDESALGLQGAGGVGRGRGDAHLWCARCARDGGSGGGTPRQGAPAVLRAHARGRGERHSVQQLIQSLERMEETSSQVGSVDRRTDQEPAEIRDQPGAGDPEFQGAASSQVRTLEGPGMTKRILSEGFLMAALGLLTRRDSARTAAGKTKSWPVLNLRLVRGSPKQKQKSTRRMDFGQDLWHGVAGRKADVADGARALNLEENRLRMDRPLPV